MKKFCIQVRNPTRPEKFRSTYNSDADADCNPAQNRHWMSPSPQRAQIILLHILQPLMFRISPEARISTAGLGPFLFMPNRKYLQMSDNKMHVMKLETYNM